MMKTRYITPDIRFASLDLEGFICESIKKVQMFFEVDEYDTKDSEDVEF